MNSNESMIHQRERNRFVIYCIYAYGMSLLIVAVTYAAEYYQIMKFYVGERNYWFEGKTYMFSNQKHNNELI